MQSHQLVTANRFQRDSFPPDMTHVIAAMLDPQSLMKFIRTNKELNKILDEPHLIHELKKFWGEFPWEEVFKNEIKNVKKNLVELNQPIKDVSSTRVYLELLKYHDSVEQTAKALTIIRTTRVISESLPIGIFVYLIGYLIIGVVGVAVVFATGINNEPLAMPGVIGVALGCGLIFNVLLKFVMPPIVQCYQNHKIEKLKMEKPKLLSVKVEEITDEDVVEKRNETTPLITSSTQPTYYSGSPNSNPFFNTESPLNSNEASDSEELESLDIRSIPTGRS